MTRNRRPDPSGQPGTNQPSHSEIWDLMMVGLSRGLFRRGDTRPKDRRN